MTMLESGWMFLLIDGAILLGAIFFFMLMIVLRAALSYVFFDHRVRRLPTDFQTPPTFGEGFEDMQRQLTALGFHGPHWTILTPIGDPPGSLTTLMAVFLHPDEASQAIVLPPMLLHAPDTFIVRYVTWLADGRVLSSQTWDSYVEEVADDKQFFGQTIGGNTASEQWLTHLNWRKRFAAQGDSERSSERNLVDSLEQLYADRQRMFATGRTWQDRDGGVRLKFWPAIKMLKRIISLPKPEKKNRQKLTVPRLLALSAVAEVQQKQALPRRWHGGMLLVSCLLFAVLGSLFFGWMFSLILLGVLFFHEGGHYLAMRALGYKNVQMIALPLAGGVTIGNPDKASTVRQTWVAMMGPLPGILLGWGLLGLLALNSPETGPSPVLLMSALTLLILNYLNLLPIQPLDGGHILQGLLPPRWFGVRILIVVAGCALAGCLAWFYSFHIIAMLAGLQLFFLLPSLSVVQKVVSRLDKDEAFLNATAQQKKTMTLEALNGLTDKPIPAAKLINWANQIVEVFTLEPMKAGQRAVLGFIYAALLAAAAMAVAATWWVWAGPSFMGSWGDTASLEITEEDRRLVETMSFAELLENLVEEPLPTPATENEILAAQTRLGQALPEDLKMLYRASNGLAALAINPLQELDWIARHPSWQRIAREAETDAMRLQSEEKTVSLPLDAPGFLYLGSFAEEGATSSQLYRVDTGKMYFCAYTSCIEQPYGLREGMEISWLHGRALGRFLDSHTEN